MNEEQYEAPESRFGRADFDYKMILLIHLKNMSALLTARAMFSANPQIDVEKVVELNKQVTDDNFISSVDFLAELLSPYIDKAFISDLEKLKTEYKGKETIEVGREFGIKKLGAITRLMDRKDLLLEKTGKAEI